MPRHETVDELYANIEIKKFIVTSGWIGFNGSLSASAIDCKFEDLSILRPEAYV
jgi:hypothetical protein